MTLEQQIAQSEQMLSDLQKRSDSGEDVAEEIVEVEREVLGLYRKQSSGDGDEGDDDKVDAEFAKRCRDKFVRLCQRYGVDAVDAEEAMGDPAKLFKVGNETGKLVWKDGSLPTAGFQSACPSKLFGRLGYSDSTGERGRLERELADAERALSEAKREFHRSGGGDDGLLRVCGDKRKHVEAIRQQLDALNPKPPVQTPEPKRMSPGDIAQLRSLEQARDKAGAALRKQPSSNTLLGEFSRRRRAVDEFKRQFGVTE